MQGHARSCTRFTSLSQWIAVVFCNFGHFNSQLQSELWNHHARLRAVIILAHSNGWWFHCSLAVFVSVVYSESEHQWAKMGIYCSSAAYVSYACQSCVLDLRVQGGFENV